MARLRAYLAAGVVGVLAAAAAWIDHRAYYRGYSDHAAETAQETRELQQRLHEAADRASRLAAELEARRAALDTLEQELRDEASRDPRANDPGLPDSSLQRLDRIR